MSKHVDIILDYRFHPPCHRPVKAETSRKAKPWLVRAATPWGLCFALSLWFACSVGRIDVRLLPLGILAIRIRKILFNVLGFAVWLTCLKCMSHTQQAVIILHDFHVFSWIFNDLQFFISMTWISMVSSNFGTNSGCKVRSFHTDKTMQSVEDTCFWKIVHANVVEMSRVPIIGWSHLLPFKTPFLEEVLFLYRFGSSNNVHIFAY